MDSVAVSIRENVGAYCGRTGHNKAYIASEMNMPYTTFLSKLNGPSEFSFFEGLRLAKVLDLKADELAGSSH